MFISYYRSQPQWQQGLPFLPYAYGGVKPYGCREWQHWGKLLHFRSLAPIEEFMVAEPTIALDLPLKILAWEATDGKVWLTYNDPNYLKQQFSLG